MSTKTETTNISDEALANELNAQAAQGGKKNFTLAEAKAAAGEDPNSKPETTDKPKRRTRAAKGEGDSPEIKTPRVKIPSGSTPSQILTAYVPDETARFAMTKLERGDEPDQSNYDAVTNAIAKLAKKVGEKAINLLRHRTAPNSVQVYTKIALDKLIADGQLTSKDLTAHYQKTKYTIGTARAQCNQIMTLFPALKMATVTEKGTMVLNKQSMIVKDYQKALG